MDGMTITDRVRRIVVRQFHNPTGPAVMIRQAQRRNAAAVAAGRVRLICASVEDLLPVAGNQRGPKEAPAAPLDVPFDAVLAVNSVGFWSQPEVRLASIRHLLRLDGQVALAPNRAARRDGSDLAVGGKRASRHARPCWVHRYRVDDARPRPARRLRTGRQPL